MEIGGEAASDRVCVRVEKTFFSDTNWQIRAVWRFSDPHFASRDVLPNFAACHDRRMSVSSSP
eukprot:scaffold4970_cov124-Pinguiococcus_pyrenoidosus.AAC.1